MDAALKAKELVANFLDDMPVLMLKGKDQSLLLAKQHALKCVDEIIKVLDEVSIAESGRTKIDYGQSDFRQVKEKIQQL